MAPDGATTVELFFYSASFFSFRDHFSPPPPHSQVRRFWSSRSPPGLMRFLLPNPLFPILFFWSPCRFERSSFHLRETVSGLDGQDAVPFELFFRSSTFCSPPPNLSSSYHPLFAFFFGHDLTFSSSGSCRRLSPDLFWLFPFSSSGDHRFLPPFASCDFSRPHPPQGAPPPSTTPEGLSSRCRQSFLSSF